MVAQVVVDKAGDKIIAVVVARLPAQGQRMPGPFGGRLQCLGFQLLGKEAVILALIDQQR